MCLLTDLLAVWVLQPLRSFDGMDLSTARNLNGRDFEIDAIIFNNFLILYAINSRNSQLRLSVDLSTVLIL